MQKVQSFAPAIDDWFVVYLVEDRRWAIERVVAWAMLEPGDHKIAYLAAIGNAGVPLDHEDYFYVKGTDNCPTGLRWIEVFDQIGPRARGFCEIEDTALLEQLSPHR